MPSPPLPMPPQGFGKTSRTDAWWIQPSLTAFGLGLFVVYATWAAFQGVHYTSGPYLSPFYSPELFGDSPHAIFGPKPGWWPGWLPFSPALLILWAPGGFRLVCGCAKIPDARGRGEQVKLRENHRDPASDLRHQQLLAGCGSATCPATAARRQAQANPL